MITKSALKKQIEKFPEEFTIDELVERIIFIEKLESRIQKSSDNDTISEEQLDEEIQKWFR
ncbi:hypothetical protein [Aequorivita echinoideorum]|uniref:Addiction module component n=1 Tax=Aequorivita echinoideorum TaxID=1549647 RepID=A0ABS5S685_9FLAO|nr:hypothetical protein [Aequorivita echinoideorum]MBT0608493.1 hypothetical protein [Aequorivita echinoideorum]